MQFASSLPRGDQAGGTSPSAAPLHGRGVPEGTTSGAGARLGSTGSPYRGQGKEGDVCATRPFACTLRAASPCGCEEGAGRCTALPPCALCPRTPPSPSVGFVPSVPLLRAARPHSGPAAPFPGVAARISQTSGINPAPGTWLQPGEVGGGWEGAARWPRLFRACPHQPGPASVPPVPALND